MINWELFRPELESLLVYDNRDLSKGGRPPFNPALILKVLVLQKYHNLSDEQTEFQIGDRLSLMQFLGLQPGDSVPDEKTIWDFKGQLDKYGLDGARKRFECFASQLSGEGMIAREGIIVDASFVYAPRQHNTREQNAQIKAGERPEGFKSNTAKANRKISMHGGRGKTPKRITVTRTTQGGYQEQLSRELQEQRGHPLSVKEMAKNKLRSRIRVRCEHIFGRMNQMALDRFSSTA